MLRAVFKLDDFTRKVNQVIHTKRKENLKQATIAWHRGVVRELTGARSGRIYLVPGTARKYVASAAGEAPASRTGMLRQRYRFRVVGPNYMEVGEVGSPDMYALYLEKGTRKMAARPHLQAAFDRNRKEILSKLRRRMD